MKFDPRIDPEKIGSFFHSTNDQYTIGEMGYFSNHLDGFSAGFKKCDFGKFWGLDRASERCFMGKLPETDSVDKYRYFYPVRYLVMQYRAYTPAEFRKLFQIGQYLQLKATATADGEPEEITGVICGFRETRNNFYVSIGGWPFTLGTLVKWINKDTGEPFGVKHTKETENN